MAIGAILLLLTPFLEDPLTALQRFPPQGVAKTALCRARADLLEAENIAASMWWQHLPLQAERGVYLAVCEARYTEAVWYQLDHSWHMILPPGDESKIEWVRAAQASNFKLMLLLGPEDYLRGKMPQTFPLFTP